MVSALKTSTQIGLGIKVGKICPLQIDRSLKGDRSRDDDIRKEIHKQMLGGICDIWRWPRSFQLQASVVTPSQQTKSALFVGCSPFFYVFPFGESLLSLWRRDQGKFVMLLHWSTFFSDTQEPTPKHIPIQARVINVLPMIPVVSFVSGQCGYHFFCLLNQLFFSYYHNKIADQSNLGKEGRVQADSHFKSTVYHGAENEASDHIASTVGETERSEWMLVLSSFTQPKEWYCSQLR